METKLRNTMIEMLAQGKHKMDVIKMADSMVKHLPKREANKLVDSIFASITKDEVNNAKLDVVRQEKEVSNVTSKVNKNSTLSPNKIKTTCGRVNIGETVQIGEAMVQVIGCSDNRIELKHQDGSIYRVGKNTVCYIVK